MHVTQFVTSIAVLEKRWRSYKFIHKFLSKGWSSCGFHSLLRLTQLTPNN